MLDVLGAPQWMEQRKRELEELEQQRKVANARIKKIEAENEAVKFAARQTLGQLGQAVQARQVALATGGGAAPGMAPLPGGTLEPSIPEPSYGQAGGDIAPPLGRLQPRAVNVPGPFGLPAAGRNLTQNAVITLTPEAEQRQRELVAEYEARLWRERGLVPPAEHAAPAPTGRPFTGAGPFGLPPNPNMTQNAVITHTPEAELRQRELVAEYEARLARERGQIAPGAVHGPVHPAGAVGGQAVQGPVQPAEALQGAPQAGSSATFTLRPDGRGGLVSNDYREHAPQPGAVPALRGDATTPGQQQAVQLAGMSQAQQAQQAAQAQGVQIDPRTLKQLRSPFFWVREGAKAEINARLGSEKLQLDREGIQLHRQELEQKRRKLEQDERAAQQLQQQIEDATQFQQAQGAPAAGGQPQAAPDRMRTLDAQRAQLEEQRRRLLPFTHMEQGKRAYDAVGSQLDDVYQQMARIQDEGQEERRYQQSERRLQLSEDRAARVESRAAAAAERSARALELQGESAARAAHTASINAESTLRGDFQQDTKEYRAVRDAWGKVVVSAEDPSAAGDLSLIFGYMKLLDPGSVVREGEFATAQNAAGVPERLIAQYNKLLSGERLAPATRTDFVARAKKLYGQYTKDYQGVRKQYRGIATRQGLNPDNVTLDYESTVGASGPATTTQEQQTLDALQRKYTR